jgi:hypothetical protein
MNNSELQKLIAKWLEDPMNEDLKMELELTIKNDPEALLTFKNLQKDFKAISGTSLIPENPFFFSKLKYRIEKRKVERSHVQRVRWAVYAATMSVSLVAGVLLGNQVESTQPEEAVIQTLTEEVFAEEFLVADYSIDNSLLVDITE